MVRFAVTERETEMQIGCQSEIRQPNPCSGIIVRNNEDKRISRDPLNIRKFAAILLLGAVHILRNAFFGDF